MKTLQSLIILILVAVIGGLCTAGYLHNIYLVAANDVTLLTIFRAVGIFLFPIGIILGLI